MRGRVRFFYGGVREGLCDWWIDMDFGWCRWWIGGAVHGVQGYLLCS